MALFTQIVRDGNPIPLHWGWWHVTCMKAAALESEGVSTAELDTGEIHDHPSELRSRGEHVMTRNVTFEDPSDGEVLEFKVGDVLRLWFQ